MARKIFFSWQADTPTVAGRNLVERALERAIATIGDDSELEEAVRELEVDRDTKGVPGSPPIVETIFAKIDGAAVFVPDLTFVSKRLDGRPSPNPNVLIEYGWALKSLGHNRIVPIMNTAHGVPTPESMPFDMRHLRHPIPYECPDAADEPTRVAARTKLAKALEGAIRLVLQNEPTLTTSVPQFEGRAPLDGSGRFRAPGESLGIAHDSLPGSSHWIVDLDAGPAMWLRLMPVENTGKSWSLTDIDKALRSPSGLATPIYWSVGDYGIVRSDDGAGLYVATKDQTQTPAVTFVFATGEVWAIETHLVNALAAQNAIPLAEDEFRKSLGDYVALLTRLGVPPPYQWIAGIEGIKGRGIHIPPAPGGAAFPLPRGSCVADTVTAEGTMAINDDEKEVLRPFFIKVYDKCGLSRPTWLP